MNIERVKNTIKVNEGIRDKAYKDTLGNWTTGVGHLIKIPDEDYLIKKKLTEEEINIIFNTDLNQAIDDARKFVDENSINERAFEIIVDMAFNLGLPRLSKFKKLKQALINNDYVKASEEMLDSLWAKQLPNRSKKLADEMRNV